MRTLEITLLLLALAPAVRGDETGTLSPKQAWQEMEKAAMDARKEHDIERYRAILQNEPKSFLARWEESGRTAAGEDLFYLAMFFDRAQRPAEAMNAYGACAKDETLPDAQRTQAAIFFPRAILAALDAGQADGEAVDAAIEAAEGLAASLTDETKKAQRAAALGFVAGCHMKRGRVDVGIERTLQAARSNPAMASSLARNVTWSLMEGVTDLKAYAALRETGRRILPQLMEVQQTHIDQLREQADGQQVRRAEMALGRMEGLGKPLEMLGQPAPAWTLEHAFGPGKALADYRGKVVLIDFWATWCPWCIRSFPALRDLLRDYAGKDFAVVGVTASASSVYESRYELDDDLKDQAAETSQPVLRMARGATDEEVAEHRRKEKEVIATFIANHKMTWDVVMIDRLEPAAKYALSGWPHAVVLDRQGRVRYFKRGALLRDQAEQVAKFRKLVDKLLAEK
ncbi:MAG: TlpA family protein disulfide reductase [Planctomycetota bacterium]|jgi:thiol-disulfide isomerase/thioredoxin